MSYVHYKFKSNLDHDTVTFDGLSISLGDLKKAILTRAKLPKSTDFDLQVVNAQSNEVYKSDTDLIGRNTSVIVTRVPLGAASSSGAGDEGTTAGSKGRESTKATMDRLNKAADLSKAHGSEDDKIMAMMSQATKDYSEANYVVKTRAPPGLPPATYVCYRCGVRGHWIQNCPMQFQQKPDNMAFPGMLRGVKKTHGIPQSFLLPATKDTPGAMLTAIGTYAVPKMDAEAYARGKKEKPAFAESHDIGLLHSEKKIPKELLCSLCNELLRDATIVPCCGVSFCDECVRDSLVEGDDEQECPSCKDIIAPDQLIPNKFLRSAVSNFLSESNLQPRVQAMPAAPLPAAAVSAIKQPSSASNSPIHPQSAVPSRSEIATANALPDDFRPPTPVIDEKPEGSDRRDQADSLAGGGVGQSSSGTTAASSASSTDAQGQAVPVIGKKYVATADGSSQRLSGMRGHTHSRGTGGRASSGGGMSAGQAAMLHGAPVVRPPSMPYGMPRYRPMPPAAAAPPMHVGFGPRGPQFSVYPSSMPQMMYVPTPPQPMPGGPVLTAEEFYKEKARLLEEELHKQKKSDPLDDFARELLEYKKEQRKRQRSNSSSRSRSRSRKRSSSRSPKRRYRSRSRSRSHSPYYKRSPGYRRSSRSPHQRRSPLSPALAQPPHVDYQRSRRSASPRSKYHSPPSRDRYMDDYYRPYLEEYFIRADAHYDPRYFDEYYRNFYERYTRGSPLADAYGVPQRGLPYSGGYLPPPHRDGQHEPAAWQYHRDGTAPQNYEDNGSGSRRRGHASRAHSDERTMRRHAESSGRQSNRDGISASVDAGPSREPESKSRKERERDKKTGSLKERRRPEKGHCLTEPESSTDGKAANPLSTTAESLQAAVTSQSFPEVAGDEERGHKRKNSDHRTKDENGRSEDSRQSVREDKKKVKKSRRKHESHSNERAVKPTTIAASPQVAAVAVPAHSEGNQAAESSLNQPATSSPGASGGQAVCSGGTAELAGSEQPNNITEQRGPALDLPPTATAFVGSAIKAVSASSNDNAKVDTKRKQLKSPTAADKSKLKKKRRIIVAPLTTTLQGATGAAQKIGRPPVQQLSPHRSASPSVKPATLGNHSVEDGGESSASAAGDSASTAVPTKASLDELIRPPELSRWEREEAEVSDSMPSPLLRKTIEKPKMHMLPKSVIESAEKALMSKQPRPLVTSVVGAQLSSAASAPASVVRKVHAGQNKDAWSAVVVGGDHSIGTSGAALDRKVLSIASSVRVTISQDKGQLEDDNYKDLREKLKKVKDDLSDTKDGHPEPRGFSAEGRDVKGESLDSSRISKDITSKDDVQKQRHGDTKSELTRQPAHDSKARHRKDCGESRKEESEAPQRDHDLKRKHVALRGVRSDELRSANHRDRYGESPKESSKDMYSRDCAASDGGRIKTEETGKVDSKRPKLDDGSREKLERLSSERGGDLRSSTKEVNGKHDTLPSSKRDQSVERREDVTKRSDGIASQAQCPPEVTHALETTQNKADHAFVCKPTGDAQALRGAPSKDHTESSLSDETSPAEKTVVSLPPSESCSASMSNGVTEKAEASLISEASSMRLSDEASFNPDYDEMTTQSSAGSESGHSEDEHSTQDSAAGDEDLAKSSVVAGSIGGLKPDKQSNLREKSSRPKHKKHKKHLKKHKKHKKHKKASSSKVN